MKTFLGMILVILFFVGCVLGLNSLLNRPGTIVGKAFFDTTNNQIYDQDKDAPAEGIIITLYKDNEGKMVKIAEATTTKNGEYRFSVKSGPYFIGVNYPGSNVQVLGYYPIFFPAAGGALKVGPGRSTDGPIILLDKLKELG